MMVQFTVNLWSNGSEVPSMMCSIDAVFCFCFFCMIKISCSDQNCVYFCKGDMMPRSRLGLHKCPWERTAWKEKEWFYYHGCLRIAETQIWLCRSTVPVFKPFNSSVLKLYWTCLKLFASKSKDRYIYKNINMNKVFYFRKSNFLVLHSKLGVGTGLKGADHSRWLEFTGFQNKHISQMFYIHLMYY